VNLKQNILIAIWMTVVTTLLLGVVYPLLVTALAQALFPDQANGQLVNRDGRAIGSQIIGQPFSSADYFHGRPSAAGGGYDAANSGGTNLGPTNKKLIEAVASRVTAARLDNPTDPVPIDFVTASASGLDPHISPSAAFFQVPRVARARHQNQAAVRTLVESAVEPRQFGFLGEPRVNVLLLNLALDQRFPRTRP
jgi:K+-transporting ATPase ATPase C chain